MSSVLIDSNSQSHLSDWVNKIINHQNQSDREREKEREELEQASLPSSTSFHTNLFYRKSKRREGRENDEEHNQLY
jgi:hypothetical protein